MGRGREGMERVISLHDVDHASWALNIMHSMIAADNEQIPQYVCNSSGLWQMNTQQQHTCSWKLCNCCQVTTHVTVPLRRNPASVNNLGSSQPLT